MKRQEKTMSLRQFSIITGWPVRLALTLLLLAVVRPAPAGSIEPVSRMVSGINSGFVANQDRAWMLDTIGLTVLNVANPLKPVFVRQLPLPFKANDLALSADRKRLYLSNPVNTTGTLAICDVSNPDAPVIHGPFPLPGSLRGLAMYGNLLGLALVGDGLRLMDATDPASPILRGSYPVPNLNAVAMDSHYALLATTTALRILDVSDPTSPTQVGQLTGMFYGPLTVNGHYLYANYGGSFRAIDVADPAHPALVGDYIGSANDCILMAGTRLYCGNASALTLDIYDITDPAHLVRLGSCPSPNYHNGLSLLGDTLFLSSATYGIDLVNVHYPSHPQVVGHYPGVCWRMFLKGTQAFLMQAFGIMPVDFSSPVAPVLQPYYPVPDMKVFSWDDQNLYVMAGQYRNYELRVLDPSDPTSLTTKGHCSMSRWQNNYSQMAPFLQAGSGLVFASYSNYDTNAYNVTDVYDVRDPVNPKLAFTFGAGYGYQFPLVGCGPNHLVYLKRARILDIMDFTNPANPQQVNSIKFDDYISASIRDGQLHVLITTSDKELVYSLADPVHPRLIDYRDLNSLYYLYYLPSLCLQGHDYYLTNGGQSGNYHLDLIDPSNPTEPHRIAHYATPNYYDTYSMTPFTVGDQTYALSGGDLTVFRFTTDPPPIFVGTPLTMQSVSRGDLLPIHWQTDTRVAGTAVRLELWNAQGLAANLTEAWSESGDTTTTVGIPALPDGYYTVRATSTWNPQLYADSLISIRISGGSLRLLAPVGGETWQPGQTVTVRWAGDPDKVGAALRFELWRGTHKLADLGTAPVPGGEAETRLTLPANLEPATDYYLLAASQSIESVFAQNPAPIILSSDPAQSSPAQ